MKTRIIITSFLAAAALLAGCSKETPEGGPQSSDGNRVVFTLGGLAPSQKSATRAAGDNDTHTSQAATEDEKKIESLLAVVFTDDGNYYKTFETDYNDGDNTASFDVEKNGTYYIHFVANADEELKEQLLNLTDHNSDTRTTDTDLETLLVTQPVGTNENKAYHPFVMFSKEAARITSKHGVVTNGGTVTMQRLAVRIDIVNAADGVTINSVKFVNRTKQSRLAASNDMSFSSPEELYETKEYAGLNLEGSFDDPKEYKASIYSYENVNVTPKDEHLPALEISYTMDDLKLTHTVKFFDSTDPEGNTPLALKRNYLYRVVLTKQLDVTFNLTVEDWSEAPAFQIDDIPFDKHDQDALNAKLKVYDLFTDYNVKTFDQSQKKVTFYDQLDVTVPSDPKTVYFTWTELQTAGLTAQGEGAYVTDNDGNKYRLPTEGELNLLLPMFTEAESQPDLGDKKGRYHPWWNDNPTSNTANVVMVTTEFEETIYLKNGADGKPDASQADNPDYTVTGKSQLKLGGMTEQVVYPAESDKVYNICPAYGVRFKGSDQCAAYRWETCQIASNPLERYFSIKIKALGKDSKLTVDDIADDDLFWKDGFIEYKFPASGYYTPTNAGSPTTENITYRGVDGRCWSSSLWSEGDSQARGLGFTLNNANVGHDAVGFRFPLRLVRVQE